MPTTSAWTRLRLFKAFLLRFVLSKKPRRPSSWSRRNNNFRKKAAVFDRKFVTIDKYGDTVYRLCTYKYLNWIRIIVLGSGCSTKPVVTRCHLGKRIPPNLLVLYGSEISFIIFSEWKNCRFWREMWNKNMQNFNSYLFPFSSCEKGNVSFRCYECGLRNYLLSFERLGL